MAKPVLFINLFAGAVWTHISSRIRRSSAAPRHTSSLVITTASAIVDWDEPRVTGSAEHLKGFHRVCTRLPGHPAVPYTTSRLPQPAQKQRGSGGP